MKKNLLTFWVICQFVFPILLKAQPGAWVQLGVGSNALNAPTYLTDMIMDNSGNLYVPSNQKQFGDYNSNVAKWDGTSWSQLGALNVNGSIVALARDNSGNVYAGGSFMNVNYKIFVAKWDGTSWTSIPVDPDFNQIIMGMTTDHLGNLYVVGEFRTSGKYVVRKWNGTIWSTVGNTNAPYLSGRPIERISADNLGNLYINVPEATTISPYKWDGTDWSLMGKTDNYLKGTNGEIIIDNSNQVITVGQKTNPGPHSLAKYNSSDSTWSLIGTPASILTWPTAINSSGNLFTFSSTDNIMKWNGSSWTTQGTPLPNTKRIKVDNSGNIYATGYTSINGEYYYVAKWDPIATPFPTVTSPVNYCENQTAIVLTATGTNLQWYEDETGGTALASAPIPSTATSGTKTYYVSQTVGGVESQRKAIVVVVKAIPSAPVVVSPLEYCQNTTETSLTATGTNLKWYPSLASVTSSSTAPIPSRATAGTSNYYVSQTLNGCESNRATITVNINSSPDAPTVTSPVEYCQNTTETSLTATGTSLKWYPSLASVASSSTAPIPSRATAGTSNYYVSQTSNGCESNRAIITVTITSSPDAPTVTSPVEYCQSTTETPLSAVGSDLKWYPSLASVTPSSTAPIPSRATPGTTDFYVSQTSNGCESNRATISVTVNEKPAATISPSSSSICSSGGFVVLSSSVGNSYKWLKETTEVGTSQTYQASAIGSYTVTVTNSSNCSTTSTEVILSEETSNCYDCSGTLNGGASLDNCSICSGGLTGVTPCTTTEIINSSNISENILISPQPFATTTRIKIKDGSTIQSVSIFNSVGKLITKNTGVNYNELEIGENLPPGLYSLIIQSDEKNYHTKILKVE